MLYRRFVIVASLIALFVGVGMANLIHVTKEHRDIAREYPGMFITKSAPCSFNCQIKSTASPFRV